MTVAARKHVDFFELEPREAAERIAARQQDRADWLDEFAEHLDRCRGGLSLARTLSVWGLSQAQAAELFGVSRQAISKWIARGVPAERIESVAALTAATDLLVHYLKRDRIPAVVRRSVEGLGGRSLLDLLRAGDADAVLATCRGMFEFGQAGA